MISALLPVLANHNGYSLRLGGQLSRDNTEGDDASLFWDAIRLIIIVFHCCVDNGNSNTTSAFVLDGLLVFSWSALSSKLVD